MTHPTTLLGNPLPKVVTVFGSGGKTALLTLLARQLSTKGARVLLSTSTKVYPFPYFPMEDDPSALKAAFEQSPVVFLGLKINAEGKYPGPEPLDLAALRGLADFILIEGDGARRRPLKVHQPHDPVVPDGSDLAIMVLGASALGRIVDECSLHRLSKALPRWGLAEGEPIEAESVAGIALDAEGYRGKAGNTPLRILVNQADANPSCAHELASALRRRWTGPIFVGSAEAGTIEALDASASRPALILLAAGASSRWPGEKLHAQIGSRSVLEWSLAAWRSSALEDRVLVHRPGDDPSAAAALKAGFRPVVCERAERGMSESIRAGFAAINREASGAILALGDMPALSSATLKRLLSTIDENPDRAMRPRYQDRPGHPVHIPRERFEEIAALTGDRGPRDVLESWHPIYLDVEDEGVVLDLDKPAEADRVECHLMEVRENDEAG